MFCIQIGKLILLLIILLYLVIGYPKLVKDLPRPVRNYKEMLKHRFAEQFTGRARAYVEP
jgi:hypothetical protein